MASYDVKEKGMEGYPDGFYKDCSYYSKYLDEPNNDYVGEDTPNGFSDTEYESEDELVFFLGDSEDEDEVEAEIVKPPKIITPIPPDTVEKMKVLDGKLVWATKTLQPAVTQWSAEDQKEYPFLPGKKQPKEKLKIKGSFGKASPMPIRVDFDDEGEYGLRFNRKTEDRKDTKNIVCKFFLNERDCPYGNGCRFSHVIPLCNIMKSGKICHRGSACKYTHIPTCLDSYRCTNKKCKFFHPSKEDVLKAQRMKLILCRNIIQKSKCEYGDTCKFAHSKEEIEKVVEKCRYADCGFTRSTTRVTKTGAKVLIYKNKIEGKRCWRIHPNEQINNFIARTSL